MIVSASSIDWLGGRRIAERVVLGLPPPRPQAEDQASATDFVDSVGDFRLHCRIAKRVRDSEWTKLDPVGNHG